MKGTKAEDKIAPRPLFPRLHVNDTDKGGPRAPPRNKMALYEQFSIPSQRFNPSSSVPLPSNSSPSNSSSQGHVSERNYFSPFYMASSKLNHAPEARYSRSSDVMQQNKPQMEFERRSMDHSSSKNSFGTRSVAEGSSLCKHDKNRKVTCEKKLDDMDDFRVPTFVESGNTLPPTKDSPTTPPVKPTASNVSNDRKQSFASFSYSTQYPAPNNKSSELIRTSEIPHYHKRTKEALLTEGRQEKFASQKVTESTKTYTTTSDGDELSNLHSADKSNCGNAALHQESFHDGDPVHLRQLNDNAKVANADTSSIRSEVCYSESPNKIHGGSRSSVNLKKGNVSKENGSVNMERKEEASEASVVDTVVHFEVSPDDVVGLIGPKHFWKARRAIVNQQRVFAIQVFELHRIIKVQKLIAASPHLLLEGNLYLENSPIQKPTKVTLTECNLNSKLLAVKEKDASNEPTQNVQTITEISAKDQANGVDGCLQGQLPNIAPSPGNHLPATTVPDNKLSPWCFHPPANQWLVPVMSPSEGLVYKPYAGQCPPGGFMAPVYGSCAPLGVSPVGGDFMNPAYVMPSSHQPPNMHLLSSTTAIPPNYFPTPYGLPTMNMIIPPSAVEEVSYFDSSQPNGQADQRSRNSCNMPQPRSEASSGRLWKLMASRDSEVMGSTGSSPLEKAQVDGKDALPLFPMASSGNDLTRLSRSQGKDGRTRVIKVVPHNPRSATESAARIFQSIQEERQQQDL